MARIIQVVRSASLSGYSEVATSLGLDPRAMMRKAGLPLRCTDNPETPISARAVVDLLESSAQAAKVEDFGLRLAGKRRLAHLGPIGLVLREEPTGQRALESLCRYLRLLNASLLTNIEKDEDEVVIREEFLFERGAAVRQAVELAVGVMFRMLRDLLGPHWRPRRVCFSHRPPADVTGHRALFGPRVVFNAEFNGIVCAKSDLEAPLPLRDPELARSVRASLDDALESRRPGTRDTVRQLIAALLPGGRCTSDQLAQHLGVDRRTIHRRLGAEGETFSGVLRSVRSEFVLRQIGESDRSLAEIAELLGFSGQSALAHWFRAAFGCSISEWRNQHRAEQLGTHPTH